MKRIKKTETDFDIGELNYWERLWSAYVFYFNQYTTIALSLLLAEIKQIFIKRKLFCFAFLLH